MITMSLKSTKGTSSPLSLSTPEEKPKLSFSDLLKGVNTQKDSKVVQNGALVLALPSDEKDVKSLKLSEKKESGDKLLTLLKGESEESLENKETLTINPKISESLTQKELKTLVSDAKNYLKSQILQSDGYKKSQIEELPKTLKGLATLAKKFDVDVSKITLQEVQAQSKSTMQTPLQTTLKPSAIRATQSSQNENEKQEAPKALKPLEAMLHRVTSKTEQTTTPNENKAIDRQKPESSVRENMPTPLKEVTPIEKKVESKETKAPFQNIKTESIESPKERVQSTIINPLQKEKVQATPLMKAQNNLESVAESAMPLKQLKSEEKSPKTKADETLKMLLRGEKSTQATTLTPDFSVASAKVIAPTASTERVKNLESLLHGDSSQESSSLSKTDALSTPKADSFEVKINEAKQMVKYLSTDVKNAIDDYKSPFTRIKVQLNPQRLGEVDLTIVQRGKNLHVNISSNNAAINTLALNANDLKTQLSNSGINNATLNFNNTSQDGSSGNFSEQQQRRQEQKASQEYNYFDKEAKDEEILSSLEIVVHNYA